METPYELPLWIIISAVVAGVLLLGIIILIMWKVRQLIKAHIEFCMCFLVLSEKVDTLVYNEIKTKICYFYMNALCTKTLCPSAVYLQLRYLLWAT